MFSADVVANCGFSFIVVLGVVLQSYTSTLVHLFFLVAMLLCSLIAHSTSNCAPLLQAVFNFLQGIMKDQVYYSVFWCVCSAFDLTRGQLCFIRSLSAVYCAFSR